MYTVERDFNGRVTGCMSQRGFHRKGSDNPHWQDFLDWNAKQPVPLDLSDKPPEPPEVDVELNRIKEIFSKPDQEITAADVREAVIKFIRRKLQEGGA